MKKFAKIALGALIVAGAATAMTAAPAEARVVVGFGVGPTYYAPPPPPPAYPYSSYDCYYYGYCGYPAYAPYYGPSYYYGPSIGFSFGGGWGHGGHWGGGHWGGHHR